MNNRYYGGHEDVVPSLDPLDPGESPSGHYGEQVEVVETDDLIPGYGKPPEPDHDEPTERSRNLYLQPNHEATRLPGEQGERYGEEVRQKAATWLRLMAEHPMEFFGKTTGRDADIYPISFGNDTSAGAADVATIPRQIEDAYDRSSDYPFRPAETGSGSARPLLEDITRDTNRYDWTVLVSPRPGDEVFAGIFHFVSQPQNDAGRGGMHSTLAFCLPTKVYGTSGEEVDALSIFEDDLLKWPEIIDVIWQEGILNKTELGKYARGRVPKDGLGVMVLSGNLADPYNLFAGDRLPYDPEVNWRWKNESGVPTVKDMVTSVTTGQEPQLYVFDERNRANPISVGPSPLTNASKVQVVTETGSTYTVATVYKPGDYKLPRNQQGNILH